MRGLLVALLGLMLMAQAPAPADVTMAIVGPGATEWHVYIADQAGFFRNEGLHVSIITAGAPQNVINQLASGAVNFGDDGTDSLIAAVAHGLPIKVIAAGFITNPYVLMVPPAITNWSQLKGKTVILGTKVDVTAIAFYKMAAANHLAPEDFSLVVGGSSATRYAALLSGNVQGAMLAQPFDLNAQQHGMHALATAHDYIKDWMFEGLGANTAWLASNRGVAVRFVRALRKAIQFGYANPDRAVAILASQTNTDPEVAQKIYDLLFRRWRAFDPNQRPSVPGVQAVANGMLQVGTITSMPNINEIFDPSYASEASR